MPEEGSRGSIDWDKAALLYNENAQAVETSAREARVAAAINRKMMGIYNANLHSKNKHFGDPMLLFHLKDARLQAEEAEAKRPFSSRKATLVTTSSIRSYGKALAKRRLQAKVVRVTHASEMMEMWAIVREHAGGVRSSPTIERPAAAMTRTAEGREEARATDLAAGHMDMDRAKLEFKKDVAFGKKFTVAEYKSYIKNLTGQELVGSYATLHKQLQRMGGLK